MSIFSKTTNHLNYKEVSWLIFSFIFVSVFFLQINYFLRLHFENLIFAISLVFTVFVLPKSTFNVGKNSSLVFVGILILGFSFTGFFYDFSWDGIAYQQKGVLALVEEGWNPIYEENLKPHHVIWTKHYSKLMQYFGSVITFSTGSIENGKVINFLSIFGLFFYILDYFKNKKLKWLYAFLFAFNPISIPQVFTFYVDSLLGIYTIVTILSLFKYIEKQNKEDLVFTIVLLSLLMNTKLTGLVLAGVIGFAGLLYVTIVNRERVKKIVLIGVLSLLFGFTIGYNPYVTNLVRKQNIFYPLIGQNKVDIMTNNSPKYILELSAPERFFYSHFGISKEILSDLKLGFYGMNTDAENKFKGFWVDKRIGGFGGVKFGLILAISMFLYFFEKGFKNKELNFIIGILFLLLVITPNNWWARYVSHFYFLPLIIAIFSRTYLRYGVFLLMIINLGVEGYVCFDTNKINSLAIRRKLEIAKTNSYDVAVVSKTWLCEKRRLTENFISVNKFEYYDGLSYKAKPNQEVILYLGNGLVLCNENKPSLSKK